MNPKKIFAAGLFCFPIIFNSTAKSQVNYIVSIDGYNISSECVPYDNVKSANAISIETNDTINKATFSIKYGSIFVPGAPKQGTIMANGVLHPNSRSYLEQSKGKQVIIELNYYDPACQKQCIYTISFKIC